jgi:putative transposase
LVGAQTLKGQTQPAAVLADKAFDADALLVYIDSKDAKVVIPPKTNRKQQRTLDKHQYRNRNGIERFLPNSNSSDASVTRYDKLASRFGSFGAPAI